MGWKDAIKSFLLKRNTILSKPPGQFNVTEWKLHQIKQRGLDVKVVVDGGAAGGWFAKIIKNIYPNATVVMIEPRDDMQQELNELARQLPGLSVVKQLVGPHSGETEYYEDLDRSSMLKDVEGKPFGVTKRASMITLDQLMTDMNLTPDLIKLDVQGAELDVLRSGEKSLQAANAVSLEVSLIEFQKGTPLVADVMDFMKARNFRLYDIFAMWHRPLDGALAQGDFLFLKADHPLLKDKRWDAGGQGVSS